jgi:hypothetical protein
MTIEMSAIAITPDNYATIRSVVRAVARQDVAGQMELVIVGPPRDELQVVEEDLVPFGKVTFVTQREFAGTPQHRAAGIRAANAPVVVLLEEHCFPAAGWARALIERHREDWAGVSPIVLNGNPRRAVSWANYLTEYGGWLHCKTAEEQEHIPGHNSSYKKEVLLEYGDRLEEMIAAESAMQFDLRTRGHRFCIDREARAFHLNPSVLLPSLGLTFWGGRLFAANRARNWSVGKRLVYIFGAPLIPLVRFAKIWPVWRSLCRNRPGTLDMLMTLWIMLKFNAMGELCGYLLGEGAAVERTSKMEFRRRSFLRKGEPLARQVRQLLSSSRS